MPTSSPRCGSLVGFLGATGNFAPGYLKLTFSCERRSVPKKELMEKLGASCRETRMRCEDELDYTVDSLTWDTSQKTKLRTKEIATVSVEAWARQCGGGAVGTEG